MHPGEIPAGPTGVASSWGTAWRQRERESREWESRGRIDWMDTVSGRRWGGRRQEEEEEVKERRRRRRKL